MVGDALDADHASLAETPLSRILRIRKWLVLSSFALILIERGILDFHSWANNLHIVNVGKSEVHAALSLAAAFQALMLALLFVQLCETWPAAIRQRMDADVFRRGFLKGKIVKAQNELRKVEADSEEKPSGLADENGPVSALQAARNRLYGARAHHRNMSRRYWTLLVPEALSDGLKVIPTVALFVYALIWNTQFGPILPFTPAPPQSAPAAVSQPEAPPG